MIDEASHAEAAPAQRPPVLALLEALDRHGAVQTSLKVTQWPVLVGRGLEADLVLDDPFVAVRHLRLLPSASGSVAVEMLDTQNGAWLEHRQHKRGECFEWRAGLPLVLGRLQLRLRLADTPLEAEQPLVKPAWRAASTTVAVLALALLLLLVQAWLKSAETQKFVQEMPSLVGTALIAFTGWIGAWALAAKLFSGRLQFWRHARIASLAFVAATLVDAATRMLAFSFSWENLARFGFLAVLLTVAAGLCRHLWVVVPTRRQGMAIGVAAALLVAIPSMLGAQWLRSQRLSTQLYMTTILPPDWRVAAAVQPAQFLQEAASIEQRLGERLKRGADEDEDEDED
jgi:hypothetical protein